MTPGGDHVASFDVEQVEDIDENGELFAVIGAKIKPRKWVKKYESKVSERDKLKLKAGILHDGIDKEVHITQLVRFVLKD